MHSKKILTIGSGVTDVFIQSEDFKINEAETELTCSAAAGKLEANSFVIHTGGGGTNTAVGFARMGFEVRCIAEMGKDEQAHLIVDSLNQEGVDTRFLIKEKKEQTGGSVVLVAANGKRMALVHRGAAAQLDPKDIPVEAVAGVDWVHLSGTGKQLNTIEHIFDLVRQKGVRLSWNPSAEVLNSLANQSLALDMIPAALLFVNEQEWQMLAAVQQQLLSVIPEIVVTKGSRGGQVFENGKSVSEYEASGVSAIDNTGAGDAFAAGYVSAKILDKSIENSIVWGNKNAASVVQQIGAKPGLLYLSNME